LDSTQFCNSVYNRTTQKANALKQVLQEDNNKILKEIQARELTKIRGRITECLISELSKINHLAKDLDTSAATIIAALRLILNSKPDERNLIKITRTDPTNPVTSPQCEMHRKRKTRDSGEVMMEELKRESPVMPQRAAPRIIKKRRCVFDTLNLLEFIRFSSFFLLRTAVPSFKQRNAPLRITAATSLQDICIKAITDNIMDIANLQYRLPDVTLYERCINVISNVLITFRTCYNALSAS